MVNIRPLQTARIPWGWVNRTIDGNEWVAENPGFIDMPDLCRHFDFGRTVEEDIPELPGYGNVASCSTNMKSIFTTASRFLGLEEALVRLYSGELGPGLDAITEVFVKYHAEWKRHDPGMIGKIGVFVIGDDIAYNNGMMFGIDAYMEYLYPYHKRMIDYLKCEFKADIGYHSDGDIGAIIPVLSKSGVDVIYYEDIGDNRNLIESHGMEGVGVVR